MPRQKTPEAIKINPVKNQAKASNNQQAATIKMEGKSRLLQNLPARADSKVLEEPIDEPERLNIKPYQQRKDLD